MQVNFYGTRTNPDGTITYLNYGYDQTAPYGVAYTPTLPGLYQVNASASPVDWNAHPGITAQAKPITFTVGGSAPVNRAPTATAKNVTTETGSAVAIALAGSDPDGDALTFAIATQPKNGTLSGSGNARTYTPKAGFTGSDSFTYTASDGKLTSAAATVSITVSAKLDLVDTIVAGQGSVSARGDYAAVGEGRAQGVDDTTATKWLDFAPDAATRASWIQWDYSGDRQVRATAYSITSANDAAERDPRDVALEGSNDGGKTWAVLDTRSGIAFSQRFQRRVFTIANPAAYRLYRLRIDRVANPARANSVQLAEWELLAPPAAGNG